MLSSSAASTASVQSKQAKARGAVAGPLHDAQGAPAAAGERLPRHDVAGHLLREDENLCEGDGGSRRCTVVK